MVDRGLYKARFSAVSSQKNKYDVTYELPRPVKGRKNKPHRGKGPTTRLQWKILSLGYFDRQSKNYTVVQKAQPVAAVTSGRTVTYPEIFPGVTVRFANGRTKLKEEIVLSQSARDNLPKPAQFGIAPEDAFLMVAAEFKLTPANLKVFARKPDKSKKAVKQGDDFSFEGEDRIEFEDEDEILHFFFPRDFAFAEADSSQEKQVVRRFFYTERGKHFLLAGVPWSWVQSQPRGTLVIDPSTAAATLEDVWLESTGNFNNHSAGLLVGHAGGGTSKKRTLIEFDLSAAGLPAGATIVKAQLKLKYYSRAQLSGVWVDRNIQAHQVLVDWNEAQATKDVRLTGTAWSSPYGGIDGTDAQSNPESSVLFTLNTVLGSWQSWDLTGLTRLWHDGSAPNFGVILLADNEDVVGYDLRFRSSDDGNPDQPVLQIIWTQSVKTVYFLKDHLGSIRATVDDIGQVVGYDDYDPWGFILAGRSMATGASTVQGAAKNKFTGKEWDDEFGLNWYHFPARPYDPEIGMWRSMDPLWEKFPDWSPYNYTLNNPVNNFDPDGLLVRSRNQDELEELASRLNKHHEGADIRVVKVEGEDFYTLEIGKNSTFDFGTDNITLGLYDAIVSDEIVFDVVFQEVAPPGKAGDMQKFGGGYIDPYQGGATIYLDPRGNLLDDKYVKEDVGVVFLHEAVGHGHSAKLPIIIEGTKYEDEAVAVNAKYTLYSQKGKAHGGYKQIIRWKKIGLWKMTNMYWRQQFKKGRKIGPKDR